MNKIISVASGFQYSVNIGYDLNQDDKLQNFIPTKSSLNLLKDILDSTNNTSNDRARVLVGAYGKGKSHIVLTILSILMGKSWDLFTKLKEKIEPNSDLAKSISNYYDSHKKILPVVISGGGTSVQQDFLLALQKTLSENGLLGIMPDTNFKAAVNSIDKWSNDFPETFSKFKDEIGQPIDQFIKKLQNFDIEAYADFETLYPKLTSGSAFNPFLGFDVPELYESVVKSLKKKGYSGIFVVYDEFSKFLEANIKHATVSDTKLLQDFAEKCNRSGELQLHLMLISHKEISNYIDVLPKQKVDGWRGVSERFKHIHLNNNFTQTYEIISSVIKKTPNLWDDFQLKYANYFNSLLDRYASHSIFSDMNTEEVKRTIRGCYPLHPITTFILPRLSERVAQNERTLFTFLSAKGTSTLSSFIESQNTDSFSILTPDVIFDYFESLFRKEPYSSELHKNYSLTKSILDKLNSSPLQAKIIKTLSLIYVLEQFDKIKPTIDELYGIYSLDYSHVEIKKAVDHLINEEYVVYLKVSNDYLRLKQSSGVDVKQKIADAIARCSASFSVKDTLNLSNIDNYMYPSRYNDEREMTRYFSFKFIDSSEVSDNINWDKKSENIQSDGVIYGIIPDSEESIKLVRENVLSTSNGCERCLFVIPKKFYDIRDVVLQFNVVMKLREESQGDDLLFDEYEVIYEDLRDVISEFVNSYTHPEHFKSIYIHQGKEQSITRKAALSGLMSTICENVYSRTPVINNEAINKNELTGTAFTSRNKIIAGLLRNSLEPNLGLTGAGQEVSIMRSTLIRKNILITENSERARIQVITGDDDMDNLLRVIIGFILDAKRKGKCRFDELYRSLVSPEGKIGLRKSIIPIYLAAVLHEYKQQVIVVNENGVQIPLNVDALIQIEASPASFSLEYLEWDSEKAEFVQAVEEIFKDFVIEAEKELNPYDYVVSAMKRWYMSLPKYSKDVTIEGSNKCYRTMIRLLAQNIGSHELLFEKFPKIFGFKSFKKCVAGNVDAAKQYYDNVIPNLAKDLIKEVKQIFASGTGRILNDRCSLTSVIQDWCDKLDPSVFDQMFENGADRCIGFLKTVTNDEKTFVLRLAKLVTDLRIEDWDEKTVEIFTEKLKEFKLTAEEYKCVSGVNESVTTNNYSLTYMADDGTSVTKKFARVEQTPRGKLLMNSLLSDIETMGHSISEQEKRQILMEVLKKLC